MNVSTLLGKIILVISGFVGDDVITFITADMKKYQMYHDQDCCENVRVEDVCGDYDDLIGSPLLQAEEITNESEPYAGDDSYTWTFYKFATIKGSVTIRWLGESNGYYSESVDFKEVKN